MDQKPNEIHQNLIHVKIKQSLFDIMLHGPNIFKYGQVGRFENQIFIVCKCIMVLQTDDEIVKTDKKSCNPFY